MRPPMGRGGGARSTRAPRRAGFFLLSGIVLKKRVLQWGCASKPLWTCSRALLPRDTQPAGRPRATRASSAAARSADMRGQLPGKRTQSWHDITLLDPPGLSALVRSQLQPYFLSIGG